MASADLDGHRLKNTAATWSRRAAAAWNQRLPDCTTMENHLVALLGAVDFMRPGFWGAAGFWRRFARQLRRAGTRTKERRCQTGGAVSAARTKGEVASELPTSPEIIETVQMQRRSGRF